MEIPKVLGPEPESLAEFTAKERKAPVIDWYRTPIARAEFLALHEKSDVKGAAQTLGYLAILAATATAAFYSFWHWAWPATVLLVFLHGMVTAFLINGVHELGHGTVFKTKWANRWIIPVLVTLAPFYGGWLFFLCNNTQHIGLQDLVPDFRLCCRTFTLNPFVRFLYWQMNYHTEHHMYAAVPCYNLGRLHRLIRHDLPHCPHGLVAVWTEIAAIQSKQDIDPTYQHRAELPTTPTT